MDEDDDEKELAAFPHFNGLVDAARDDKRTRSVEVYRRYEMRVGV